MAQSYPMVSGDGAHSYAKNSTLQRRVVDAAKELIYEAISDKLDLKLLKFDASNTFQIADLGCSIGPNTFIAVQNIIEAVELKLLQPDHQNLSSMEFQVLFNDHYDNDFNTLFKSLPHSRKYFAAGVPGSFHNRLFPKATLHFVHSSYSLHWLSKVPKELVDQNSPLWNKESARRRRFVKEVAEAYSGQFKNDMESFLNARAQELVPGGLMVITIHAIPDGIPFSQTGPGVLADVLGLCLVDLAKMGVISEEKVDSFNSPTHTTTPKELKAIIQRNENFTIERMEKLNRPVGHIKFSAKIYTLGVRAVFEGLIKEHFGEELVEQMFNYFRTKAEENASIIENTHNMIDLFLLLKRTI